MLSDVSQDTCLVPRMAKSCALPVVGPWGSVGVRCVQRRCVCVCVWQEGNERQAMPSSKPIGAEAPEPDSTSSEGDTRREHNRGTHILAQKAAAETWLVALGGLVGNIGMGRV